jgi:hypothetical protein
MGLVVRIFGSVKISDIRVIRVPLGSHVNRLITVFMKRCTHGNFCIFTFYFSLISIADFDAAEEVSDLKDRSLGAV